MTRIAEQDRIDADPTPGMRREQAIDTDGMWSGLVRTAPHTTSGWHHHGEQETTVFVLEGAMRLEFGPDGREAVEAGPGDFVHVPKGVVHREGNPTDGESRAIVTRAGRGPSTVNRAGPEGSAGRT